MALDTRATVCSDTFTAILAGYWRWTGFVRLQRGILTSIIT